MRAGQSFTSADMEESKEDLKHSLENTSTSYKDVVSLIGGLSPQLNKVKSIEDFVFEASYRPHIMLAILNNASVNPEDKLDKKIIEKCSDYNNLHYIQLSIENKNFKSELLRFNIFSSDEYSERVSYYSFRVAKDICLVENGTDTLKNGFVTFERTFDASPKLNLILAFERKRNTPLNSLALIYDDVIFDNGKINFEFDYSKIGFLNYPEIKKLTP
jgi:hypothetical protein